MPKQNIHLALFDIRPKKESGKVRVAKVIDLKTKTEAVGKAPENSLAPPTDTSAARPRLEFSRPLPTAQLSVAQQIARHAPPATDRDIIAHEIEDALGEKELVASLRHAGGVIHDLPPPRVAPEVPKQPRAPFRIPDTEDLAVPATLASAMNYNQELKNFWVQGAPAVHASPAAREVEQWLKDAQQRRQVPKSRRKLFGVVLGVCGLVLLTAVAYASSDFIVQKEAQVLQQGNQALTNLQSAKADLQIFDFTSAADHFALAHDDFQEASGTLKNLGASFLSLFGDIPGLGKVRSAQNLVKAGEHISKAGEDLSRSFSEFYQTNFFAFLNNYDSAQGGLSLAKPIEGFQDALKGSQEHVNAAAKLLQNVDISAIPEDKRATFEAFRAQIPSFQAYIGSALEYSDFLLDIVGKRSSKTYLVLLQNTSERRPTGGFPGTYAIVSFDRGTLKKIFVDDIYNPDGQIRANMIPPVPLQHVTPNWGMRDVNWFADFPTSARKIEEYYRLDGGAQLDGVLSITPTVVARLLAIIGPVDMPEYGVTLDANNFLAEIQDEVEYGENRTQPKKIVVDFQPKFFEQLAEHGQERGMDIVKVLLESLQQKHILAYFDDEGLQQEMLDSGFAGELKNPSGDYLQVAFSNIKGGKADAVTANSMKLEVDLANQEVTHTLTITRAHNGGDSKYAFYNRENAAYVKVYAPKGSQFVMAEGFSKPDYRPLINHEDLGFRPDPDLATIEASLRNPIEGIDVFEESGKTVFGFWMITKAKKANSMNLVYRTPSGRLGVDQGSYQLLWQKQSGSEGDQIRVQAVGSDTVYDQDLSVDREIKIEYQ